MIEPRNIRATGESPVSHQTVKLSRGRHASPEDGVCVMELASMLAHEPFSDHPQSVCPVIGAFLRAYNDRVDDILRDDLYAYAARIVGTRGTLAVERQRTQMCREWARRTKARGGLPREPLASPPQPGRLRGRLQSYRRERIAHRAAITSDRGELDSGGHDLDREAHRAALRFVDQLIAAGRQHEPEHPEFHALSARDPRARTK